MATTIDTLQLEITSSSSIASSEIEKLANSLTKLKSVGSLKTVATNLQKLSTALQGLSTTSSGIANLNKIATAFSGLSGVSTKGMNSTVNSLKKIPEIVQKLDTNTLDKFAEKMKKLNTAVKPLANNLAKAGNGMKSLMDKLKGNTHIVDKVTINMKGFNSIFTKSNAIFAGTGLVIRKFGSIVRTSVNSINDYIENMNLFNVSMGSFFDEAKEYAEFVQNKMGIDASEWMRGQGIFMAMATGFGLANEKAYEMSKGMTELSYDMSSFYNIPIEEALTKMRSAMAGEIEPLRQLGISLTEATLQEIALANGITKKVNAMTEAEKAQLRYVAIVQSATKQGVIGDFARTLDQPANAIRILQQQIKQLGRAFGSVFIPILVQAMPYLQAFVKVLTSLISRLATFFGFTMPKWTERDWGAGQANEASNALDEATAKAKEYKKSLQGFDELNIIPAPQQSGGNGAGGVGGDLGLDIKSVWNDEIFKQINEQTDAIIQKFKDLGLSIKEAFSSDIVKVIGSIGLALVGLFAIGGWEIAFVAVWEVIEKLVLGFKAVKATGFATWISSLGASITPLFSSIGAFVTGTLLPLIAIVTAVASVVYVLWENFDKVVAVVKNFIEGIGLKETFEGIKESLTPLMNSLVGLKDLFTAIGTFIVGVFSATVMPILAGAFTAVINVIKPIITIITGVIEIFGALGSFLVGIFTGDMNKVLESIKAIGEGIWKVFAGMVTGVIDLVAGFVGGIIQWFISLWDELVGHSIIPDMAIAIMDWFKTMIDNVINNVVDFVTSIIDWITSLGTKVVESFKFAWTTATNTVSDAWNLIVQGGKNAWEGIKSVFSTVGSFFKNVFSNAWKAVVKVFSVGGEIFTNIKDGILTAFKAVVNGIIKGLNRVISIPFEGINTALRTVRDISIFGLKPFSGLIRTVSIPQIPLLASGGMVDTGQMFIAREAGPELVGTIGGKTAVANNNQIVEGISAGVYEAVVKAMSGDGKNITINATFELDGNAIGKSVVSYHNGVVTQTGMSPLLI